MVVKGVLMVSVKSPPAEDGFLNLWYVYQKGIQERMCTVRLYEKQPEAKDYHVNDSVGLVVTHRPHKGKTLHFAITPELGAHDDVFKHNPRDTVASEHIPDPVILAALGGMSPHF